MATQSPVEFPYTTPGPARTLYQGVRLHTTSAATTTAQKIDAKALLALAWAFLETTFIFFVQPYI